MTPIFPSLPVDLGVYTLTRLLGSHATCDRYIARQSHVERSVVIEVLRPDSPKEVLDAFLRSARLRVSAQVPRVSQVLETMVSGNIWYITSECPDGVPLSKMRSENWHLSTSQACNVIQQVGALYDYCDRNGLAASALTPDSVFLDDADGVTFLSPLIEGSPSPELHIQQLDGLAALLRDVRPEGEAGQTRVATLLEWLGQEFDGQRLEWQAITSTAAYIKENVAPILTKEKIRPRAVESSYARKRRILQKRRRIFKYSLASVGVLLGACAISCAGVFIAPLMPHSLRSAEASDCVYCKSGNSQLRVMCSPVSIGNYKRFLADYESMSPQKRNAVNKNIPPQVKNHTPAEWSLQLKAADKKGTWRGQKLSYNTPVHGVSYWNAVAYANYQNASLPSLDVLYTVRMCEARHYEEWTSSTRNADSLFAPSTIVLPDHPGREPILETDLFAKKNTRSFRIVLPANPEHTP